LTDRSLEAYFKGNLEHQREFLARSDPAMVFSEVFSPALGSKTSCARKIRNRIHPILGSEVPRGHLHKTADYIQECEHCYVPVQSAFKYDFPVTEVQQAIALMNATPYQSPIVSLIRSAQWPLFESIPRLSVSLRWRLLLMICEVRSQPQNEKIAHGSGGYSRELKGSNTSARDFLYCGAVLDWLAPDLLGHVK
jgi:phosphoenolpyruvate carboxylase